MQHPRRRATDPAPPLRRGILPLLDAIAADALDPSYAASAHRRRAGDPGGPRPKVRSWHRLAGPTALLACGLGVGFGVAGQRAQAPSAARARAGLVSDAETRTSDLDSLARQVAAVQADVASRQSSALQAGGSADDRLAARARALLVATGEQAVTGAGVVVVLGDRPTSGRSGTDARRPVGGSTTGQVLDRQIQDAVNALWAGGAEAVAVGGERISPLSAVRTAGQTVLVNYRPLTSPYDIRAVGPPGMLASFRASAAAARLASSAAVDGITVQTRDAARLDLPAASVPALREARP